MKLFKLFLFGTLTIASLQHSLEASIDAIDREAALKVLNLSENATRQDIEKAAKNLTLQHHPDRSPADQKAAATNKVKEIGQAKEFLLRDYIEHDEVETWFTSNKDKIKEFIRAHLETKPLEYDANLLFALKDWAADNNDLVNSLTSERNDFIADEIRKLLTQMKSAGSVNLADLTPDQIAAIPLDQIKNFTIDELEELSSLDALTIAQVRALKPSIITDLTIDLANFTVEQIKNLTPQQVAAITGDQLLVLNKEQIQSLNIAYIPAQQFQNLQGTNTFGKFNELTPDQIKTLNAEQIKALLRNLTEPQIAALTPQQINSLDRWSQVDLRRRQEQIVTRNETKQWFENNKTALENYITNQQDLLDQPIDEWLPRTNSNFSNFLRRSSQLDSITTSFNRLSWQEQEFAAQLAENFIKKVYNEITSNPQAKATRERKAKEERERIERQRKEDERKAELARQEADRQERIRQLEREKADAERRTAEHNAETERQNRIRREAEERARRDQEETVRLNKIAEEQRRQAEEFRKQAEADRAEIDRINQEAERLRERLRREQAKNNQPHPDAKKLATQALELAACIRR